MMSEPIGKERSQQIRNVSFLTAVMVVLIHSNNVQSYSLLKPGLAVPHAIAMFETFVSDGLALCAVPFFLAMSAYLFFRNYAPSIKSIAQKYTRRFHSLVIPYLFWNGFHYIVQMAVVSIPAIRMRMDARYEPILGSQPGIHEITQVLLMHKYNIPFWFIQVLIVFVLFTPLVYVVMKHKLAAFAVLLLAVIATVAGVTLPLITTDIWFYLLAGSFCAIHPQSWRRLLHVLEGSKRGWIFVVPWVFTSLLILIVSNVWTQQLAIITGMAAIWFGYQHYKHLLPTSFWGRHTFLIFAIHPTLLGGIKLILAFVAGKSAMMALVSYLLAPTLAVGLIIWFCNQCELRLPAVYSFISGRR